MQSLNHKTIWITGASSGIGEALAKQLNQLPRLRHSLFKEGRLILPTKSFPVRDHIINES